MKYMGHKGRIMNAILDAVSSVSKEAARVADPFCGSGAVSWALAEKFAVPITAGDLQEFARVRAAAVVARTIAAYPHLFQRWLDNAEEASEAVLRRVDAPKLPGRGYTKDQIAYVEMTRTYVTDELVPRLPVNVDWPVTTAYAGYYFSIKQAVLFDCLRRELPKSASNRNIALAALIGAASRCSASPGHTAQPLSPTPNGVKWIVDAWSRNPIKYIRDEIAELRDRFALRMGNACRSDAIQSLSSLTKGDVAFLDPPYSGVHYSRFYHVLETIALGKIGLVSGAGRYPDASERPTSKFSQKSNAPGAIRRLLSYCGQSGIRVVLTFPETSQSNGLSGPCLQSLCQEIFGTVNVQRESSVFSTLGGNGSSGRAARRPTTEYIIACVP
ncbi:MAG: DNA adenine methylase [Roseiarcus sp.]|jgi:adenine-specific DNA methylase